MFQLRLLSGKLAGRVFEVRFFPFRAGRGPENDLILDDPGVWVEHFRLVREGDLCAVKAAGAAALAVNGEPARHAVLRNGDQIEIAALRMTFGLAPAPFRALRLRETVIWTALGAVFLLQFWLIYRLLG
jgi:hypothetical protein